VVATGTAPLSYQWSQGGQAITNATAATYTTPPLTLADTGKTFTVKVTNPAGNVTSAVATLTVNPAAPIITSQPAGGTYFAGEMATLTVSVTGAGATYQWSRNSSLVPGATSASYTTPVLTSSNDNDSYTVSATNPSGSVTSTAAVLRIAPIAMTYTSQTGAKLSLYAWPGSKSAILTASNNLDGSVMRKFVTASDATYNYYATALGRTPSLYFQFNGLATIAELPGPTVPSCGGAACTFIGATGMEIADPYFQWMLYSIPNSAYDQVMFYEWGRSFWLFPQLAFTAPDNSSCFSTGFAVLMRYRAISALGYQGSFNSFAASASDISAAKAGIANYNSLASSTLALIDSYAANTTLTGENTFRTDSYSGPGGLGCADLFASLLQRLARDNGGETFIQAFWKQLLLRPGATTTQAAFDNFILAASASANKNLSATFMTTWRWTESSAAQAEAQTRWGNPQ
jgi:hypothetical protein